jgi:hypothetical protein
MPEVSTSKEFFDGGFIQEHANPQAVFAIERFQ